MRTMPNYLYKFKPIDTAIDLCRFEQTLRENVIFMPDRTKLNDPFESSTYRVSIDCAGGGYTASNGHDHPVVEKAKNQYIILSLTQNIHSPLMWAHYANNYTGICFIFKGNKTLSAAKRIKYTNQAKKIDGPSSNELDNIAYLSLFEKMNDWSYEEEWRLAKKGSPCLMSFEKDEIVGIVVGHNMPKELKNLINNLCDERHIPCFCTYILPYDADILFFPTDMGIPEFDIACVIDDVRDKYTRKTYRVFAHINKKQIEKWKR